METALSIIREAEQNYISGTTTLSKYVSRSMYEDLSTIDAYLNSMHISGETDSLGREKPFFNIVTAAVNIWFRATDLDRKNIKIKSPTANKYILSLVANAIMREFMNRENIGKFLNDWGLTLAQYGSAVLKFVENSTGLHSSVVSWNRLIVDTISFEGNPVIEIFYYTPSQLRKKGYDKEQVDALIAAQSSRTTMDNQRQDNTDNFIKVYELHGELPKSLITGKQKDEDTYVQQIQVCSYVETVKQGKSDYLDFVLYSGEEKNPYMITHLLEKKGQTLSDGAVRNLFNAQWMVNHSMKAIKDELDITSKIVFQTADPNYVDKNFFSNMELGDVMVYNGEKSPNGITRVNNTSTDITALKLYADQWRGLASEINSTPDILKGETPPSGTAYRLQAIVQQEAHSNFEMMTENKGLYLEKIVRDIYLPYILKQMDTAEEISAVLDDNDIQKIDAAYIPREAAKRFNRKAVEAVLNGGQLPDLSQEAQGVKNELSVLGKTRFFKPSDISDKTWKEILKDFTKEVEIEIVNENYDKQAVYETLNSVLQVISQTQGQILNDPNARFVFNKILELTGTVSPLELNATPTA